MMRIEDKNKQKIQIKNNFGPKDAIIIKSIYLEAGIYHYDPSTINQLLQYLYQTVANLIKDAKFFAFTANRKHILPADVSFALTMNQHKSSFVPREEMHAISMQINSKPLPKIKYHDGLRLPPEKWCMISKNYRFKNKSIINGAKLNSLLQNNKDSKSLTVSPTNGNAMNKNSPIVYKRDESKKSILSTSQILLVKQNKSIS